MRCVAIGSSAEAGSSISRISGSDGQRARDAQPLLLAARERQRRLVQPVLDLVPERGLPQALLDALVQLGLAAGHAVDAQAVGDVLEDRLRERVRLLEHHADPAAQRAPRRRRARRCRLAVDQHRALDAGARDDVVHPVQRAQERALAAARRPDEGGHQVGAGSGSRCRRARAWRRSRSSGRSTSILTGARARPVLARPARRGRREMRADGRRGS